MVDLKLMFGRRREREGICLKGECCLNIWHTIYFIVFLRLHDFNSLFSHKYIFRLVKMKMMFLDHCVWVGVDSEE